MRTPFVMTLLFAVCAAFADDPSPTPAFPPAPPNLPIPSVCARWLLGLPVLNDPYASAFLRLNYEARRIDQALRSDGSTWVNGAATYYAAHFDRARDAELNKLDVAGRVELIGLLLNYDDLHTPSSPRRRGYWDNPWRVNGRHEEESPDPLEDKPFEYLNSREIIDLIDHPGSWNELRRSEARRSIEHLIELVTKHPELFPAAFRAGTVPLTFDPGVGPAGVLNQLGQMFGRSGLDPAARERAVYESIATLRRAIASNDALRIRLGWGPRPKNPDLVDGATAYLRGKMDQQDELMEIAIKGLTDMRGFANACR